MPRGDRSTATREALLEAAARVFVRRGRYGATVRAIADEAGVTVPAVYYHFEGTEQLYDTLVREGRARFREMAETTLREPGEPAERLRRLARTYARFGRTDPTLLRLLCMELFGPLECQSRDRGADELRAWIEQQLDCLVDELLARTGEDGAACKVRLFIALMNGLLVEQARSPEAAVLDEALADRAVDLFVGSAVRPANGPPDDRRATQRHHPRALAEEGR